jgi:outer membrane receptor protein involved in Fe transport
VGKEIGLRSEAMESLQSSLALWSLQSQSEIVYNADSDIGSTSPNGASSRQGIELNQHWTPSKSFIFDVDASWVRAHFSKMNDNGEVGNLIPNAVGKVFNSRVTWHENEIWSLGLEWRYIGSYPLSQDGSLVAPASTIFNARYRRKISSDVDISLDILNALNRRYFDIAYQQDFQACTQCAYNPNGETVHPGEPRQFRLTLRWSY